MSNQELENKLREYKEYMRMIEELEALKSSIGDEIKEIMKQQQKEKLIIGQYKISYSECCRKDLDKKALQAEYEEIYNKFVKETSYMRLLVS